MSIEDQRTNLSLHFLCIHYWSFASIVSITNVCFLFFLYYSCRSALWPTTTDLIIICLFHDFFNLLFIFNAFRLILSQLSMSWTVWILCRRIQLFEIFCVRVRRGAAWIMHWWIIFQFRIVHMRLET